LLTAYLTTSKIWDGSWQGTDTAYLNQWNEQMCKLVEYSPTTPLSLHCSRMLFRTLHTLQVWNQLMT
jgi:hypothetical protein